MKRIKIYYQIAFAILALFCFNNLFAQRAQVIHNAADTNLKVVDVWINGDKSIPDFEFRKATPFIDLPKSDDFTYIIEVKPAKSNAETPALLASKQQIMKGESVYLIVNGTTVKGFEPNPNGKSIAADLYKVSASESADDPKKVALKVFHGATDVPTIGVNYAKSIWIPNLTYSETSNALEIEPMRYVLGITDTKNLLFSVVADLEKAAGASVLVLASGFLYPEKNQDGDFLAFMTVMNDGTVNFLENPFAKIQLIHNAADPALAKVDVALELTNLSTAGEIDQYEFEFRKASPYTEIIAQTPITAKIYAPGTKTLLASFDLPVLDEDINYSVFINGVAGADKFAANPDKMNIQLNVYPAGDMRMIAKETGKVDLKVFHGATDAPAIDAVIRESDTKLATNLKYGLYSSYTTLAPNDYIVDIKAAGTNTVIASYNAPLKTAVNAAATVFASGFLDPSKNQNGQAFGLYVVLANGTVMPLPEIIANEGESYIQILHNAPDPAAAKVDLELIDKNGGTIAKFEEVSFRTGSPYVALSTALAPISIKFYAPKGVTPLATFNNIALEKDKSYIIMATGVLDPDKFDKSVNPNIDFKIITTEGRRKAINPNEVDVIVAHGAVDAPRVDIKVRGGNTLFEDVDYASFSSYLSLAPENYIVDIHPDNNPKALVGYTLPAKSLVGQAVTIFASGFLDPAKNQNGAPFGLFVLSTGGSVLKLPIATSRQGLSIDHNLGIYPNPSADKVYFSDAHTAYNVTLSNSLGATVATFNNITSGFDVQALPGGVYNMVIHNDNTFKTGKLIIVR